MIKTTPGTIDQKNKENKTPGNKAATTQMQPSVAENYAPPLPAAQ